MKGSGVHMLARYGGVMWQSGDDQERSQGHVAVGDHMLAQYRGSHVAVM